MTPYTSYMLERWRHGDRNAMHLWREIVALGYPGSHRNVSRFLTYLRQQERHGESLPTPQAAGVTPQYAVRLLLMQPSDRSPPQQAALVRLRSLRPEIGSTMDLLGTFLGLVRQRDTGAECRLMDWMRTAVDRGITEFRTFVDRLFQDLPAVMAGLTLPWSQGQTEGQILPLKLIRRQMYGRGNFDLVRERVLRAA